MHQLCRDPVAITCCFLMLAYMIGQMMIPSVAARPVNMKGCDSPTRNNNVDRRRIRGGKSSFAISVNRRLMELDTPEEVLDYALFHAGKTDIVNVVTALHRSAKLAVNMKNKNFGSDSRVISLLDQLQGFFEESNSTAVLTRAVGNASWALGKLNFKDEHPVLAMLQEKFGENVKEFKPEEFMNTVWAFAELRHETKEAQQRAVEVAKAAVACIDRFPDFTLQQVVYLAWALARLAGSGAVRTNPEVVEGLLTFKSAIITRVVPDLAALSTKNLAMISWAIAQLCVHLKLEKQADVEKLLSGLADDVIRRGLRSFGPGELASVVWALNKCHVEHSAFLTAFRIHVNNVGLRGFNSQDLANILCAFVNMGESDDEFIMLLGSAVEEKKSSFNRLEKMMVQWAFAQRAHLSPPKLDIERSNSKPF